LMRSIVTAEFSWLYDGGSAQMVTRGNKSGFASSRAGYRRTRGWVKLWIETSSEDADVVEWIFGAVPTSAPRSQRRWSARFQQLLGLTALLQGSQSGMIAHDSRCRVDDCGPCLPTIKTPFDQSRLLLKFLVRVSFLNRQLCDQVNPTKIYHESQ
jgi:hypothetical protein